MISHMPSNLRSAASFLFVAVVYWLCLWCIIKGNRGNRVIECGSITLMLSFLMMLLIKVANLPDWVLSSLGMLIFLLCLLTMFSCSYGKFTRLETANQRQRCRPFLRLRMSYTNLATSPKISARNGHCGLFIGARFFSSRSFFGNT
jgi:hypothetical protein